MRLRLPFTFPSRPWRTNWRMRHQGGTVLKEVFIGKFDGGKLAAYLKQHAQSVENYESVDVFSVAIEGRTLRVAILSADSVAASNVDDPAVIRGMVDRSRRLASPFGGPALLRRYYKRVQFASPAWLVARPRPRRLPWIRRMARFSSASRRRCHFGQLQSPASSVASGRTSYSRRSVGGGRRRCPRHLRESQRFSGDVSQRRKFDWKPWHRSRR